MAMVRGLTKAFLVTFLSTAQEGDAALRGDVVNRDVVKKRFQSEFEALLGHGANHARLEQLEDTIRATFTAVPKTSDGGVTQDTARYVLRRYFNRQHGWSIRGLAKTSGEAGESSSLEMLKDKMPSVVFELLEQQLAGKSIGLREIAVLAATVEDMVYGESVDLMNTASSFLDGEDNNVTTEGFLALFAMPSMRDSVDSGEDLKMQMRSMKHMLHGWDDLALWSQDVRMSVSELEATKINPFQSADEQRGGERHLARVAEAVTESFGRNQDMECKNIKNTLLELSAGDGRVNLAKFYGAYLDKTSKYFTESQEYLRHHGMLEVADDLNARPTLLIPNYVNSAGNCISTSGFMSICCINECEAIMSSLEEQVAAPSATPQRVLDAVSGLRSDTVAAPRELPADLVGRLSEIANANGGEVPLHSRLFAEWMHRAYPNECPMPHKVNETASSVYIPTSAHMEQMEEVITMEREAGEVDNQTLEYRRKWLHVDDEELLVPGVGEARTKDGGLFPAVAKHFRSAAMVGVVVSSVYVVAGKLRSLRGVRGLPEFASKGGDEKPHFV